MHESNIDCPYTACLYYPPSRLDGKPCCRCDMSSQLPSCYTVTSGYVQTDIADLKLDLNTVMTTATLRKD